MNERSRADPVNPSSSAYNPIDFSMPNVLLTMAFLVSAESIALRETSLDLHSLRTLQSPATKNTHWRRRMGNMLDKHMPV